MLFKHRVLRQLHSVLRLLHVGPLRSITPKRTRWIKRVAIALALYTLVGFFAVPAIIKWQMVKQLPKSTHRSARVESVRVNPYALSLGIRGLALTEPDGSTFMSFSNFYVNFEACSSLFHWTWTFKEVRLGSPYGYVAILTNGQFNFANLFTTAPATNAPPAARPRPAALIKSLAITNGVLAVADFYRTTPFQTTFEPIEVRLTNFTTRPRTQSPYAFTASTGEGEYFRWRGNVYAFPPASSGRFELGGVDLKKYGTYDREFTQFDVREGKVTIAATYAFAVEPNGVDLRITNASVLVTNLQMFAPDSTNELVSIPSIVVLGAEADLQKRSAKVRSVETIGGSILARRFRDGTLELWELATPPTNRGPSILNPPLSTNAPPSAVATGPITPWSVLVESITVRDYAARVEDEQPPRAATLVADQIALSVKGLSLASNAPIIVEFSTRVNSNGNVKVEAQGTVLPLAMNVEMDVQMIDLRPFQPYVEEQQVKLTFNSGNVSTKGRASVALEGAHPPTAKFTGDVMLNDVAVIDQTAFQDLFRWKQMAVRGIDFTLSPMSVKVQELACDDLAASVVIGTNKQLTALAALPPGKTNAVAVAVPAPKPATGTDSLLPFPMQLDLLALTNASIHLRDLSINPNCEFDVQQFNGTVRGLSSALNTVAEVDINGRVNESAPFSVTGKVNPFMRDMLIDLVVTNRNTELTAFTTYMEKFGGHELKKGKFTVGLRSNIRQQTLDAEIVVFIDQLTLGPRNNSPDATKLPVKLGVALLKDRNGRIELGVPVNGRLDDPKFKVGPIIWQVVMNLLAKAATSPFALLGALVGGGEELSFIQFAPGQSSIPDTETPKIDKLGRALYDRPALNLEITGSTDDSLDRAALAWLKLERELKGLRMAELAGKNDAPASAEWIRFEQREYARLLKAHYKQRFNRSRPSPEAIIETNGPAGANTNILSGRSITRPAARRGAEMLILRDAVKSVANPTNAVVAPNDARSVTRLASLPTLDADDDVLMQMERELFSNTEIGETDLRELMQQRAQGVQRALLQTQKVESERLFILAPKTPDPASKGQSCVNLSLN